MCVQVLEGQDQLRGVEAGGGFREATAAREVKEELPAAGLVWFVVVWGWDFGGWVRARFVLGGGGD